MTDIAKGPDKGFIESHSTTMDDKRLVNNPEHDAAHTSMSKSEPTPPRHASLAAQLPEDTVEQLLMRDLAIHAAIRYYETILRINGAYPPRAETITRTATTFLDFYDLGEVVEDTDRDAA